MDGRRARVQPGVVQAALNAAAAPHGLEFGPDTSTVDQATIAGMVGNNSSGSRSIVYGESKDKVLRVSGCARRRRGGRVRRLRRRRPRGRHRRAGGGEARGGARAGARAVPRAHRRRLPADAALHLRLQPARAPGAGAQSGPPAGRVGGHAGAVHRAGGAARPAARPPASAPPSRFTTLHAALDANVAILETGPSAVEFLDLEPLRRAPNLSQYRSLARCWTARTRPCSPWSTRGARRRPWPASRACARSPARWGLSRSVWLEEPEALAQAAALRRAVLPLLMGAPGAERPAAFVEDIAVAPERLAGFVDDLQRIVASHGTRASFTGHASAGCLHLRPMLDLKTASGVARMEQLAAEIGRLVAAYHGAFSGEHGCGRSRSWFLPELLGPGLYEAMVAVKDIFDPRRLLNPGVIVGGPPVGESLRFGADYRGDHGWTPRLSYAAEGGFGPAVEKCFGAGPVQEAHRHHVSARRRDPGRGALHTGARQRAAGRRVRRRTAGGDRRERVPGRARHLRRLQGVQDGVPRRRRHGGAQGGVAGRAPRARGGAPAGARHRRLPPAGRPGRAGGAAGERARPHPRRAGGDRLAQGWRPRGRCRRSPGGR